MSQGSGIAVVTGAGSGLGREFARALLGAGYSVALAGRREALLRETVEETAVPADRVLVVPTDVTRPDAVRNLFERVAERFGRLDLLVNNAGMFGPSGTPDEVPVDGWTRTVATNLTGSFLCAREAFALMRRQDPQGGRIINNGSLSAHTPRAHGIAYTATKHAITGLTKSLSLDGRPYNIACGQIDIGNAATDMTAAMNSGGTRQADGSVRTESRMDAAEAAAMVVHMASLPLTTNVQFVTIMATTMPFIGRG